MDVGSNTKRFTTGPRTTTTSASGDRSQYSRAVLDSAILFEVRAFKEPGLLIVMVAAPCLVLKNYVTEQHVENYLKRRFKRTELQH